MKLLPVACIAKGTNARSDFFNSHDFMNVASRHLWQLSVYHDLLECERNCLKCRFALGFAHLKEPFKKAGFSIQHFILAAYDSGDSAKAEDLNPNSESKSASHSV
jgi:hypothetical protein